MGTQQSKSLAYISSVICSGEQNLFRKLHPIDYSCYYILHTWCPSCTEVKYKIKMPLEVYVAFINILGILLKISRYIILYNINYF